jgi:hypothetical protein
MLVDPRQYLPFDARALEAVESGLGHPLVTFRATSRFEVAGVNTYSIDGELEWAELSVFDHEKNDADVMWTWTTIRTSRPDRMSLADAFHDHAANAISPLLSEPVVDEASLRRNDERIDPVVDGLRWSHSRLTVGAEQVAARTATWADFRFTGAVLASGFLLTIAGTNEFREPLKF